jgi:hypothetical protein
MSVYCVCVDCGVELITDEEQETGRCERCYEEALRLTVEEQKHPDDEDNHLKRKEQ